MRSLVVCFLLLCCSTRLLAIDAQVGHNVFYVPDATQKGKLIPIAETYFQVNPRTLHYTTNAEKLILARIKADLIFSNDSGIIKEDQYILQTIPKATLKELANNKIIDLRRYSLNFGMVRMKLVLTDIADSSNKFTFRDSFTIAAAGKTPMYSGLQLLDTTFESKTENLFKKNGQEQVPLCTDFLDDSRHFIHYYTELYESDKVSPKEYPLIQKVFIAKKENTDTYGGFVRRDTVNSQLISQVYGNMNIESLTSGNYYLRVTLENKIHRVLASQILFFQRLNTNPVIIKDTSTKKVTMEAVTDTGIEQVNLVDLNKTFVAKYTLPQVRSILKMLLPVSDDAGTRTINDFFKTPEDLYMRYYIYNHFLGINKDDPEQAWKEYSDKVIAANKLYSSHGSPGYTTERGFIYLRYGPPTDVITVENESGTLPYEIWQYNTLTQMNHRNVSDAVFLFYKAQGGLDYRLLHSTVEGETQNEAWRTFLYVGGGGINGNSRAEQYIGNR